MAKSASYQHSSKEQRVLELVTYLITHGADAKRKDIIQKFSKKFKVSENMIDRYLAEARPQAQIKLQKRQKKITEAQDAETVEAAGNGLKTKTDRLLNYQTQVDACITELNATEIKLTTLEKVALRKTIKELQSEISKIEGDYAAQKQQHEVGDSFLDFLKHTSAE